MKHDPANAFKTGHLAGHGYIPTSSDEKTRERLSKAGKKANQWQKAQKLLKPVELNWGKK